MVCNQWDSVVSGILSEAKGVVTTERKDACNRAKAVTTGIPVTGKNADCWPVCQREVRGVRFYQILFPFPPCWDSHWHRGRRTIKPWRWDDSVPGVLIDWLCKAVHTSSITQCACNTPVQPCWLQPWEQERTLCTHYLMQVFLWSYNHIISRWREGTELIFLEASDIWAK